MHIKLNRNVLYKFYVLSDFFKQWIRNCHAAHNWIESQPATGNPASGGGNE